MADDLISRSLVIDAIDEICNEIDDGEGFDYEKWREYFTEMPPAQRWTSRESGEPPKESGWYIVTAYDGRTSRTTFAKYQTRLKRWDLTGARAYWRILAWMPLPEPYAGNGGGHE